MKQIKNVYKNKDKILERHKSKSLTPEQIEFRREYMKEYRKQQREKMTPEDIERRRQYMKLYNERKKNM